MLGRPGLGDPGVELVVARRTASLDEQQGGVVAGAAGPGPDQVLVEPAHGLGQVPFTGADAEEVLGEQRLVDIVESELQAHLPPPEVMRRISHRLLDWQREPDGRQDDATLLLVEWSSRELPGY